MLFLKSLPYLRGDGLVKPLAIVSVALGLFGTFLLFKALDSWIVSEDFITLGFVALVVIGIGYLLRDD